MAGWFELLRIPFPFQHAKSELNIGPLPLTLNHNEGKIFYRTPPGNQRRCSGFRGRVATERPRNVKTAVIQLICNYIKYYLLTRQRPSSRRTAQTLYAYRMTEKVVSSERLAVR